jgi:hypothetical protein
MFFDMGKNTKSNPASKGDRVKKIFFPVYQINTDVSLTAMLSKGEMLRRKFLKQFISSTSQQ